MTTTPEPVPGSDEHLTVILDGVAVISHADYNDAPSAAPAADDERLAEELHTWAAVRHRRCYDDAGRELLAEVAAERAAQDRKWGEQNHPDGTGPDLPASFHGAADQARELCQLSARMGNITWRHILLEEVAEALEAPDPAALRTELIQVAAVCAQWAQAIDRRTTPAEAHHGLPPIPLGAALPDGRTLDDLRAEAGVDPDEPHTLRTAGTLDCTICGRMPSDRIHDV